MILLPLPLLSCGRSLIGNSNIRPWLVIAKISSLSRSAITCGVITSEFSGKLIKALPLRFFDSRSSPLHTKP
ncbi:Uncharacterised protein [Vibrio cholerae]|uniref:Uncharacterized protein n=1 Tax=Vibrio cholerae TaxID=666 RepID=A0A655ZJ97_VIBCL|nr:Uncharacterised protein [Vibrio cholerae]